MELRYNAVIHMICRANLIWPHEQIQHITWTDWDPLLSCFTWVTHGCYHLSLQPNGFFVECGALDGERSSNTLYLEKKLNWTGLLVEMDSSFYHQLRGKNRRSYSINACLSPYNYPIRVSLNVFYVMRFGFSIRYTKSKFDSF